MSDRKIKAIIKRADEPIGHVSWISDTLVNLQKSVGGMIEWVPVDTVYTGGEEITLGILCDEEGRLKGKPENCEAWGISFVGDIILLGAKGEEFADVPIAWGEYKRLFNAGVICNA